MVQFADNLECVITKDVQKQGQPVWQPRIVHIRADVTGLDDTTIHFGVLQSNPLPDFQLQVAQGGSLIQSWLAPFGGLRIDQIFFLIAWSGISNVSPQIVRSAGLTFGIVRPGEDKKRWLTTFPLLRRGTWVAWCVEIDMSTKGGRREMMEIVLSEENTVVLEGAER